MFPWQSQEPNRVCVTRPGEGMAGIVALTHGKQLSVETAVRRSEMGKYQLLDKKHTKEELKHSTWTVQKV